VKDVKDKLVINELTQKIQKANTLIERLNFGEKGSKATVSDYLESGRREKTTAVPMEHLRFLRSLTKTSLAKF